MLTPPYAAFPSQPLAISAIEAHSPGGYQPAAPYKIVEIADKMIAERSFGNAWKGYRR
jgi:hypothetical protein